MSESGIDLAGALTDGLAVYDTAARGEAGRARAVIRPTSVEEVRAAINWARANRVGLVAQGANTGLVGSSVADPSGQQVVLSTERLVGDIDIDPVEQSATVAAGVRLWSLNDAARMHGLHLPIDLAADPSLGGMVATNTGGSRVVHYGPLRQHLLDAELVAADAEVSVFGGRRQVRKDSRGLDLAQLSVGSGGTFGVITSVTVALSRLAPQRVTWWVALDEGHEMDLFAATQAVRGGWNLTAFEIVSRTCFEATSALAGAPGMPLATASDTLALVEWSGDGDDPGARVFAALHASAVVTDAVRVPSAEAWAIRHGISESLRRVGIVLGHDVSVPRRQISELRRSARRAVNEIVPRARLCEFGHAGDGGLHLNVVFPGDAAPTAAEREQVRNAVDALVARDGSYSAEHGLGPLNAARWLASSTEFERRLVRAVKATVDPFGILGHPDHPYNQLLRQS
jgi:FAD/FMN-containing dehydrogenase